MTKLTISVETGAKAYAAHWNGFIFPLMAGKVAKISPSIFKALPKGLGAQILEFVNANNFKSEKKACHSFHLNPKQRVVLWGISQQDSMFELLRATSRAIPQISASQQQELLLDVSHLGDKALEVTDAIVSRITAETFQAPKTSQKKASPQKPVSLTIICTKADQKAITERVKQAEAITQGTNTVRRLTMMPGNLLTPKLFRKEAENLAKKHGLKTNFITTQKLKTMKAGAFLAVPQGSNHQDSGIAQIVYKTTKKSAKHLTLVGKGITYDTGGVNLKPPAYMFGMQGDMGGAATVLALILTAKRLKWPINITAYLAIADNAIGQDAYRPNDVITSLSGKTIEIVHTDAEGRMVLADTLTLASRQKTDLILDFATLTGSCVGAIGSTYCGAFTNREAFGPDLIAAGKASGERLWPFPLDEDFGECLESDVADIKQCRLKGGVDHIEAAYFLKQFIEKEETHPWVHFDLSASENAGGLGHVATETTGVGVRFASEFIRRVLLT